MLRGPRDTGSANPFNTLAELHRLANARGHTRLTLLERKADHLCVGEQIKIIAITGLTKDQVREYLIGFEGSALQNDHVIAPSTK